MAGVSGKTGSLTENDEVEGLRTGNLGIPTWQQGREGKPGGYNHRI